MTDKQATPDGMDIGDALRALCDAHNWPPITIAKVDALIRVLGQRHHRQALARRLFSTADECYIREWTEREPFAFWCHLDDHNRQRAIHDLAPRIYSGRER